MQSKDPSGIYVIEQIGTGRCYIGSSHGIYARWYAHRNELKNGTHHSAFLQNAWNKYGADAFEFRILERCESVKEILLAKEQEYLDAFRPAFNICPLARSRRGTTVTEDTKAQISAGLTGFKRPVATHCKHGHLFDEANTKIHPTKGWRSCRTCLNQLQMGYSRAKGVHPRNTEACKYGHPWTEATTGTSVSRGRTIRYCRICRAEWERNQRVAQGAKFRGPYRNRRW